MSNDKKTITVSLGWFWAILFFILFILKVSEVGSIARLSWWWVTAPLWGPIVFWVVLWAIFGLINMWIKRRL